MSQTRPPSIAIGDLVVDLRPSRVPRHARLTVERDGSLIVAAAEDVSLSEIEGFVREKRLWIYRRLASKEALRLQHPVKDLVDGEGFKYLGRSYRLLISEDTKRRVKLERGRLHLPRTALDNGLEAIIDWYTERGVAWLGPRVDEWARRLRVSAGPPEVRPLGFRWGLADRTGSIRVHWATMQLPPSLVEYVIVHELIHVREPSHGAGFWGLLRRAMPDFEDRKVRLAITGSTVWLGQPYAEGR